MASALTEKWKEAFPAVLHFPMTTYTTIPFAERSRSKRISQSAPRSTSSGSAQIFGSPTCLAVAMLALLAGAPIASAQSAPTKTPVELGSVKVIGEQDTAAPATVETSAAILGTIPGGTSVVDADVLDKGRLANVGDALKLQPGVLAQSANGGEATRVSIRGSGIVRGAYFWGTGLQVELDGLPVSGPAGSPYESVEPLVFNYVEVLRGANGFDYGPLSLGGVVNYATRTGYDASRFQARFEAGSFGYQRVQFSSGQVIGPFDYYVSLTRFKQEGYRLGSVADSHRAVFNVGYKISDRLTTRFYYRYADQYQENPGYVTWSELQTTPRKNQFTYRNVRYNPGSHTVANRTKLELDQASSLEAGLQFRDYPLEPDFSTPMPRNVRWQFSELDGFLQYRRNDLLGDQRSNSTTASVYFSQLFTSYSRAFNAKPVETDFVKYGGWDIVGVLKNDFEIRKNLWLTTGLSGIKQDRDITLVRPATQYRDFKYSQLAPRLGLRYEITPDVQVYTNYTRTYEAPTSTNYPLTVGGIYAGIVNLRAQKADTGEIGGRAKFGIFTANLSYYYSAVRDELLTVQVDPITVAIANGSPTVHQGVEASLEAALWQSDAGALLADGRRTRPEHRLTLRQSYTYSDFHYRHDSVWGKADLPAVPGHVYQAQLVYEHKSGFYASANAEAVLQRYAADFANTIFSKPYTIFGVKVGYAAPQDRWEIYGEIGNIADKNYAAVVSPIYNAKGIDSAVYSPGLGRYVSGGISVHF